jgi:uncharacterized protein YbjT (DUF2867 family)
MKILIIGANGKVGKKVVKQLKETHHHSIAMVRNENQVKELQELGADKVIVEDLEKDFSHAFKDVDAVIFTAGSGGNTGADKTMLVDLWGLIKAVNLAEQFNIKHFVQLSATNSPNPDEEVEQMRPYAVAKHVSDFYLKQSSLDYTIIHPGPLLNDEPTGKIDVSLEIKGDPNEYLITREDVANILVQSIGNKNVKNKAIFIKNGNTFINEALDSIK